jgi:putative DNA primase/helicase
VRFDGETIPENEQDPDLARKIIATELPGVFNWVLCGLKRLLHNRKFTESSIVRDQIEEYQRESDSVAMFLEERGFQPSTETYRTVSEFYDDYKQFCQSDGYRALSKKNCLKRCRATGYFVEKKRGYVIWAERAKV